MGAAAKKDFGMAAGVARTVWPGFADLHDHPTSCGFPQDSRGRETPVKLKLKLDE